MKFEQDPQGSEKKIRETRHGYMFNTLEFLVGIYTSTRMTIYIYIHIHIHELLFEFLHHPANIFLLSFHFFGDLQTVHPQLSLFGRGVAGQTSINQISPAKKNDIGGRIRVSLHQVKLDLSQNRRLVAPKSS